MTREKELRGEYELRREKQLRLASYLSKLYNCDKLPEQIELVKNMLNLETRNLTNGTDENCEKLTKAIQDKNGKIPIFGLSFLYSLLSRSNSDLLDLIAAVESVKGDDGIINIKKCSEFSNILSRSTWGDIPKAVQEMNKQGTLLKATKI